MQFKKMTLALTLLLALSTTACSVGGGGGDVLPTATSTTTTTTTNNSSSSNSSSSSTTTNNSSSSSSSTTTNNSGSSSSSTTTDNSGSSSSSTTTDNSGSSSGGTTSDLAAEKAAMMKNSVSSFFNTNSNAASYKYATDEAARLKLWNEIQDRKTNGKDVTAAFAQSGVSAASCANASGSECHKDIKEGVVLSYAQSYAGYAVIRESLTDAPKNSYVYLVNTPTTNRAAVADATYKGIASYSSKYSNAVQSRSDFTLNVKGDNISGAVTATTGTGITNNVITFNAGTITASDAGVTFSGTATFAGRNFNGGAKNPDLTGVYYGAFAGANAEEVAGVFETDDKSKEKSAQGAFAGTRQ